MHHIILLISLSSLLISSSLSYTLPPSYYEAKHKLIKSARNSKKRILVSTSTLNNDLKKILKSALQNSIHIDILYTYEAQQRPYSYYNLFKSVKIHKTDKRDVENYIIFDQNLVCYSEHYFVDKEPTLIDYQLICSDDSKIIHHYINTFKKDFLAN